jgi:hypothetical protein
MSGNGTHVGEVYGIKKINIMITKEEIIEILFRQGTYIDNSIGNVVQEENWEIVADEILSKFCQHDVSVSFCDCTQRSLMKPISEKEYECFDCGKEVKQNVH